jgi:hypothetical protein
MHRDPKTVAAPPNVRALQGFAAGYIMTAESTESGYDEQCESRSQIMVRHNEGGPGPGPREI